MFLQQSLLLHSRQHDTIYTHILRPTSIHVLLLILLPVLLLTLSWFPSTNFYAHFEFAHNKWNENESFYIWLRWKRWHINEEKTLLRVSERDFSNQRHWEAVFVSCYYWHVNKEKIWLRVMEVAGNTSRSPPILTTSLVFIFWDCALQMHISATHCSYYENENKKHHSLYEQKSLLNVTCIHYIPFPFEYKLISL